MIYALLTKLCLTKTSRTSIRKVKFLQSYEKIEYPHVRYGKCEPRSPSVIIYRRQNVSERFECKNRWRKGRDFGTSVLAKTI